MQIYSINQTTVLVTHAKGEQERAEWSTLFQLSVRVNGLSGVTAVSQSEGTFLTHAVNGLSEVLGHAYILKVHKAMSSPVLSIDTGLSYLCRVIKVVLHQKFVNLREGGCKGCDEGLQLCLYICSRAHSQALDEGFSSGQELERKIECA